MAHVSRLSSAGELATGLAHELNQPLTAISHNCHAALTEVSAESPQNRDLVETLEDTYQLAQRAGDIIRSMRRFTRKEDDVRQPIDINHLIKETIRLTRPEARDKGVDISLSLDEQAPKIPVDPVQIQQVLLNHQRNSLEAMNAANTRVKKLSILTEMRDKSELVVSVIDTGPGLPQNVANTLFSQFQTTKKDSMGLGLAISQSIVEAHGGKLWVAKDTPSGVTFSYSLPLQIELDLTTQKSVVYIVDDDHDVRKALTRSITQSGFCSEAFSNADEFLMHADLNTPCCLILDVRMPGMSGPELQQNLTDLGHRIPIIFITGHGDIPMSVRAIKDGAFEFLEKPYQVEHLLDTIKLAIELGQKNFSEKGEKGEKALIAGRYATLTGREKEVLNILVNDAANVSNKSIANKLDISHRTGDDHRAKIMRKMQANSLVELVKMINLSGLFLPDSE